MSDEGEASGKWEPGSRLKRVELADAGAEQVLA
ncbi:hypothetical protein EDD27_9729 [Nonomuraea polychroma]|uniref:Uncharacterized protein n=1 Tax=Nonomuraea polychroma TaxID=46176 RepID=A0A438MM46_9ACTN|nr:hypothetical protein EDD27_9729 [Nonomuraea polychroma]